MIRENIYGEERMKFRRYYITGCRSRKVRNTYMTSPGSSNAFNNKQTKK